MGSSKVTPEAAPKGKFQCGECDMEFTGAVCPDCGNKKGNKRMAKDGIPQADHRMNFDPPIQPPIDQFGVPLSEEDLMNLQYTKMAQEEFQDNMRISRLNMSAIKKLDSDMKLEQKRAELKQLKDGIVDSYPPSRVTPQQPEMPTGPLFGGQSPQSQFLSQLMKMGDEERAVFIEQLSEADPQALHVLNSMTAPQQQPQQMNYSNPMGMYPGYFPPAVQQEKVPAESPIDMMRDMFALFRENQPDKDNSSKDLVRELKDELRALHTRIDGVIQDPPGHESKSDPILQYLKHIEQKVDAGQKQPTLKEQLTGIRGIVDEIKELGFMNTTPSDAPISDQIQMKQLDHNIDMEKKQFGIDQEHLNVQRDAQKTRENLVQQLFSRGLTKPNVEESPTPNNQQLYNSPAHTFNAYPTQHPVEIVDEIQTDAGSIREVRRIEDNPQEPE